MSANSVRNTVLSSLAAIGANREAQFYADLFAQQDPEKFALIVVDPRCLKNPLLEALISSLKLLFDLGLSPVLLVGAMDEDRTTVKFQSQRLSKELDQVSVRVAKLNTGTYALMPEVKKKAKNGLIPVLEMTERRGEMNLLKMVELLDPNKVIFLQPSGGLSKNGNRISNLGTAQISGLLEHENDLSAGQQRFLSFVADMDIAEPGKRSYIIASPLNLLSELFTTKGSGTLIRRQAEIKKGTNFKGVSQRALKESIDKAFGKSLRKDFFKSDAMAHYIEVDCRGGAIFTSENELTYLSKFWVSKEAQGDGLAKDIWQAFNEDIGEFYWRSKLTNPFNDWYMRQCDGMQVVDEWRVFWKNLDTDEVTLAIKSATLMPEDFTET